MASSVVNFIRAEKELPDSWWELEPITISELLGITLAEVSGILACRVIFQGNLVFTNWHIFEKVIHELNGNFVDFEILQLPTVSETSWGVRLIRAIDSESPFDEEILGYIAVILHLEGFVYIPEGLEKERSFSGRPLSFFLRTLSQGVPELDEAARKHQESLIKHVESYMNSMANEEVSTHG